MICLHVNNTSILFDPYTEHRDIIWLSRHIWIQLHLLWSSYLEATGSYFQNCPDFERKMTDPGQWSTVRCLEMTRTTSQAVAPPAETPLLHLLIKNGKKKLFSKLQRMTNCLLYSYSTKEKEKIIKVSITEDQMLPLNQLFKRKKKKRFCGPILVQLSPKQLKRLWKLYQLFLIYRFLWGYKKKCFTNCKQVPVNYARRSEQLSWMSIHLKNVLLTFLFYLYQTKI